MKLIDKTLTDASRNAKTALHNWRDTYTSESGKTFKNYCDEGASTGIIWNLLINTDDFLGLLERTNALYQEMLNQTFELCVVHRAYLKQQIE